jgi:tetraacyldisaccharide 4'-kinase
MLEKLFNLAWYGKLQWTWVLWPLSLLYGWVVNKKRRAFLQSTPDANPVPVIVVGNITVGGTGKTPVVQTIVRHLISKGYSPGIISRGYGGSLETFPHVIQKGDSSKLVGDEPYMLFHSLSVPVVIDPVRNQALGRIVKEGVDVVISDDGLQHYGLNREVEICVIDGSRGIGNGQLIPVGPMREPKQRLASVDFVLTSTDSQSQNQQQFQIQPLQWVNVKTGQQVELSKLAIDHSALAIAGIGNPDKFFNTLKSLDIHCAEKAFEDHYAYSESDFTNIQSQVLMTEKDAVKIAPFARDNMWYLQIQAQLPNEFLQALEQKLGNE